MGRGTGANPVLQLKQLSISFGGLKAVSEVSLDVGEREVFSLIGPNGAGKTTVFNIISGFYRPDAGEVLFQDRNLVKHAPHEIASFGIGRTFQNLELFSRMTVLENLLVAEHLFTQTNFWSEMLRIGSVRKAEEKIRSEAREILRYFELEKHSDTPISELPFPVQKRIELARALALRPRLLLLDEPAGGLNRVETHALAQLISRIRDEQEISVLLVEHDMSMVMDISDRIAVLDYGKKIADGTPHEIRTNQRVIEAYLGKGEADRA